MNQDKRTPLPGLQPVCVLLPADRHGKLITHFNLPPSLMALGEIVCFGLALDNGAARYGSGRFKQRLFIQNAA